MEAQEKDYIKGFNTAYLRAKHQPELLNKLVSTLDNNNSYCEGILAGKEEYDIEKAKSYFKKFKKSDSSEKAKDKNKDNKGLDIRK